MGAYVRPAWQTRTINWPTVTDAELAAMEDDCKAANEANKAVSAERKAAYQQMVDIARVLYGRGSREVKYLEARRITHCTFYYIEDARRQRDEAIKKAREAAQKKEDEAAAVALVAEATAWLIGKGKAIGTDFEPAGAVRAANELAYDEYLVRVTPAPGGFVSFVGNDNCENCDGWDGESRRCQCGNRRVSWTRDYSHSFKHPYIYAEAF